MEINFFKEKLNKVEGNVYVIEEIAQITNGSYEAELAHDNVNISTLSVYTGPKLTGDRIQSYVVSTPSMMPWKRRIRIYAEVPCVYISYETDGDTVEAEDINKTQESVIRTQKALNGEEKRALKAEERLAGDLLAEANRAGYEESVLDNKITAEIGRAQAEEQALKSSLAEEIKRAETTEETLRFDLASESFRAQKAEEKTADALAVETIRAGAAEQALKKDLDAEIVRATTAEGENATALASEITRAKSVEKTLTDHLSAEVIRAMEAEKSNLDAITAEVIRAKGKETELQSSVQNETSRAETAEKSINDNLSKESNRAKAAEKQTTDNLQVEIARATAKEKELLGGIDGHKAAVDGEIQALKEADTALEEQKADISYVNIELGKRYTKEQIYTKAEVLAEIEGLIGSAPDTLDTFKEIADALGNDPNFATTMMNALSGKVDKVAGKQLTTNDYSNSEKSVLADVNGKKHTHSNKSVLDKLTETLLANWSASYTHISDAVKHITVAERTVWNDANEKKHTHSNKSVIDKLTQAMLDKLTGIAAGAEVNVQSDWSVTDTSSDAYIKNKPSSMPASDVSSWAKAASKPSYGWTEITGKPSVFPPSIHNHTKSQISDMPTKLSQFSNDAGYITSVDVDTSQNHTHANKTVLDKITQAMIDKIGSALTALPVHTHTKSQITDFPASLPANGGNAATVGGHTVAVNVPAGAKFTDTIYTHPNSGVTAGRYQCVTVNTQGHVTGGTLQGAFTWAQLKGAYTWGQLKGGS